MKYILFLLIIFLSGCDPNEIKECEMESIGIVSMNHDKSLTLQLRAVDSESGTLGDAYFIIKVNDPRYDKILKEVLPIEPGETKDYLVKKKK